MVQLGRNAGLFSILNKWWKEQTKVVPEKPEIRRKEKMSNVKTRFAPSPTGRMHVGNLRTALYAYLIAKHDDGTFMLRIEDTDQERFRKAHLISSTVPLKETGLVHDEGPDKDGGCGPYVQSERMQQVCT